MDQPAGSALDERTIAYFGHSFSESSQQFIGAYTRATSLFHRQGEQPDVNRDLVLESVYKTLLPKGDGKARDHRGNGALNPNEMHQTILQAYPHLVDLFFEGETGTYKLDTSGQPLTLETIFGVDATVMSERNLAAYQQVLRNYAERAAYHGAPAAVELIENMYTTAGVKKQELHLQQEHPQHNGLWKKIASAFSYNLECSFELSEEEGRFFKQCHAAAQERATLTARVSEQVNSILESTPQLIPLTIGKEVIVSTRFPEQGVLDLSDENIGSLCNGVHEVLHAGVRLSPEIQYHVRFAPAALYFAKASQLARQQAQPEDINPLLLMVQDKLYEAIDEGITDKDDPRVIQNGIQMYQLFSLKFQALLEETAEEIQATLGQWYEQLARGRNYVGLTKDD
ncbi:hypothetical protein HZB02_01675 [Candidatus Woesearchaeota archaeon]|nr:hypothetical protein [Candidatus Woesearchaeota archaeon]